MKSFREKIEYMKRKIMKYRIKFNKRITKYKSNYYIKIIKS